MLQIDLLLPMGGQMRGTLPLISAFGFFATKNIPLLPKSEHSNYL